MKKIVLIGAFTLAYFYGAAQSFTAVNATTHVVHPNPFQIGQGTVGIWNTSSSSKQVLVERIVNVLATGHTSYFCWDVCYTETTNISDNPLPIAANDTNYNFYFDLDPHGVTGLDTGCYRFFDMANPADNVEVCFYFDVTTGITIIGNASPKNPLSVASPNPANTISGISYYTDIAKNPSLVIYNLLGGKVFETKLKQKQGAYFIDVSGFNQGIYLYSLIENGKTIATKKLVVAHK